MKVIIAGSRNLNITFTELSNIVDSLIKQSFLPSVILSGDGGIVDNLGSSYGTANFIPVKHFPANWNKYGRAAGPIRNQLMVNEADALFLIWDGVSPGSQDVKNKALKKCIPIQEVIIKNGTDKRSVIWKIQKKAENN